MRKYVDWLVYVMYVYIFNLIYLYLCVCIPMFIKL